VVCDEIGEDENTLELEAEMRKVLKSFYEGVGLAAPQIGHRVRAVLVADLFLVNPEITDLSNEVQHVREGCLSYPHIEVSVPRAKRVRVKHRDGQHEFSDFDSAIAQHEIEHLDGVCKVADIWRTHIKP
jgi:peptide deformylase